MILTYLTLTLTCWRLSNLYGKREPEKCQKLGCVSFGNTSMNNKYILYTAWNRIFVFSYLNIVLPYSECRDSDCVIRSEASLEP